MNIVLSRDITDSRTGHSPSPLVILLWPLTFRSDVLGKTECPPMLLSIIKAFLEDMTVLHVRALLHGWQSITALCLGSLLSLVSAVLLKPAFRSSRGGIYPPRNSQSEGQCSDMSLRETSCSLMMQPSQEDLQWLMDQVSTS